MPRTFLLSASAIALAAVVAFLTVRKVAPAAGVAVATAPALAGTGRAFAVVETFDIDRHRTVPLSVTAVEVDGRPAPFEAAGAGPALVSFDVPREAGRRGVTVRTSGESGPGEATFDVEVAGPGGASTGARVEGDWPVRGRCGDRKVTLLAAGGVPVAKRNAEVLVLVTGPVGDAATVSLSAPGFSATAPIEAWGGAVLHAVMPAIPAGMRLAIEGLPGGESCRADLALAAPPAPVLLEAGVDGAAAVVAASARDGRPAIVLLAAASPAGPGPIAGAALAEAGRPVRVPLPGPGPWQVRAVADPMQPGAPGAGAMVVAGDAVPGPEWDAPDGPVPAGGRARAVPFIIAARAAGTPVTLSTVASTSGEVRARRAEARGRRQAVALSLLGAALGAQVLWALALVVRGTARRKAAEDADDLDAPPAAPRKDLWSPVALAVVLLGAIGATVYLLSTL
ncbi:MAG: hypothetical protein FJ087_15235 [Deltaproteobacteria bacterium]|nr:hypothetical protein [Deltaproteobacteria bacterium]